ncbi:MAG: molybdopterin-dependent oxidoreductase [Vulcanimicrobiaceae bacterium]
MAKDVTLTIDGLSVTVPEGTLLVEAAKLVRTDIPVYCYHEKLGPAGLCRICLVEIEKTPKLQIGCNTTVAEGMVVHTHGAKVEEGRRAVLEFLLLNHPLDCPICDKGGECDLQDFSMAYGQGASRLADPKGKKPKAIDLGPTIVLDDERCIVCQRCSRFDEIITAERSLVVKDRGQRDVISTATGAPYVSSFSGNVTELCPVGALTSKTYRFKSRPWDLRRTPTTCSQCAVGCQLNIDERHGEVLRTMSVESDAAKSDGWLCDRGRYNVGFYSDSRRLTAPLLRRDGDWEQLAWDDAIELWAKHLREALAAGGPGAIGAIGGGRLLNEEIVLLGRVMRGLGSENLDWRAGRQRQASTGLYRGGYGDLERAQLIVAVGRPPSQTAPVMDLRIRKAVSRSGARYVTVGLHPGRSFVAETHVATVAEAALLAEGAERVAFVWDGIDVAAGADAAGLMAELSGKGVAVCGFIPGEQPNARGAETFGMLPHGSGSVSAAAMLSAPEGLRVLSLFGVNPVLHHPVGAAAVRKALERIPFVVATELFLTETSSLASLVLPVRGSFEKRGHVTDLTGDVLAVEAGHDAPAGTLSDGEVLVALAAELGIEIPAPDELLERASSAFGSPAGGFGYQTVCGSPPAATAAPAAGSLRLAIAAHPFAGGGTVFFDDRLDALRPVPTATFAPATAEAASLHGGELIDLVAGERVLRDLVVQLDASAPAQTVSVLDGLPAAPANGFGEGETVAVANVRAAEAALVGGTA